MNFLRKLPTKSLKNFTHTIKRFITMDSYVWIDLELTGLDLNRDTILEVACIITKPNLTPVGEGLEIVIHQPDNVLNSMNSWCIEHHAKSGLTEASRNSKISLSAAETIVADYIKQNTDSNGIRYIAGNSVYMDKIFLQKWMPLVDNLLNYRVIDVSSLKVLCRHWYPKQYENLPEKNLAHRALDDIKNSIEELKRYEKLFLKKI